MVVVLLLCLVDPVWHCDHLVGGKRGWLFCFSFVCGMCALCVWRGKFVLPLSVISRL